MNPIQTFQVIPEEEGLIEGFKNDGHSCSEKFAELIDNSLDANAIEVKISYYLKQIRQNSKKSEITRIVIGDNGTGIVSYKIRDALRIGKRKESTKKIGKYGFGLKTACFGLGQTLMILTKTQQGELESYVWNLADTKRKDFDVHQVEISSEMEKVFNLHAGDTGTVLVIDNVHSSVSNRILSPRDKEQTLNNELSKIFHRKIEKEVVRISVNSKVLEADPVIQSVSKTLVNKYLAVGDGKIKVRFVELDEVGPSESDRGTYVYLNDRLINVRPIQDKTLRFDHASFNHLRLEINIPNWDAISEELGLKVNNQKNGLQLSGKIRDEISDLIYPSIQEYRQKLTSSEENNVVSLEQTDDSKNNNSWNVLKNRLDLKLGVKFSATQQKEALDGKNSTSYNLEPRLLNKTDTYKRLPEVLKQAGMVPFPIKNGEYIMVDPKLLFKKIPKLKMKEVKEFKVPSSKVLNSLTLTDVTSEKKALNYCYHHGIIQKALGESQLSRTVEGMERLTALSIMLGDAVIDLDGVQIETDAGYEGKKLHLMEAKMIVDEMEDINFRQLILPHAHYESKIEEIIEVRSWLFLWYKEQQIARFFPVVIDWTEGYYAIGDEDVSFKIVEG